MTSQPTEPLLPCDVKLPPATTITAGCKLSTLLEALRTRGMMDNLQPTSEDVVEAVARAIERADNETGYEYDHLHIECSDWGIHLARAAIAAMPSIPQENDAEVTEAKGTMSVPMYDRCDTYVAGQYVFNYLRTFLAAAGIDASKCKLVVELPDRDTQRQLVSAVQRDSKGPPRSAGRIGNHSGLWQGVEYEFSVKGWNDPTAMTSARDREQPK